MFLFFVKLVIQLEIYNFVLCFGMLILCRNETCVFVLLIFCAILFWLVIGDLYNFKIIKQILICLAELILDMSEKFKVIHLYQVICFETFQIANTCCFFFFL